MRCRRIKSRLVSSLIAGGLLACLTLAFTGCPDYAGDCHNTLSCPLPICTDASGDQECTPDDNGDDGGIDGQED
jgi:hypothetical protein